MLPNTSRKLFVINLEGGMGFSLTKIRQLTTLEKLARHRPTMGSIHVGLCELLERILNMLMLALIPLQAYTKRYPRTPVIWQDIRIQNERRFLFGCENNPCMLSPQYDMS